MEQSCVRNRLLWVLPHRSQSGDEEVVEDGKYLLLLDAINVRTLPKEIILGIPEEVLRRYPSEDVIFAQFAKQPEQDRDVFTVSVPCGYDKGGRRVYLTALTLLTMRQPMLRSMDWILPAADALPDEDLECARRLRERLRRSNVDDHWASSVAEMLKAAQCGYYRSFCNVHLKSTLHRPQWMPMGPLERLWSRATTAVQDARSRMVGISHSSPIVQGHSLGPAASRNRR